MELVLTVVYVGPAVTFLGVTVLPYCRLVILRWLLVHASLLLYISLMYGFDDSPVQHTAPSIQMVCTDDKQGGWIAEKYIYTVSYSAFLSE